MTERADSLQIVAVIVVKTPQAGEFVDRGTPIGLTINREDANPKPNPLGGRELKSPDESCSLIADRYDPLKISQKRFPYCAVSIHLINEQPAVPIENANGLRQV
jgi:hypothetical protein